MKLAQHTQKSHLVLGKGLLVYGLPFLYFYGVADVVEVLKHPLIASRAKGAGAQWLAENNHDGLMQYVVLLLVLSFWALSSQLFQPASLKNVSKTAN